MKPFSRRTHSIIRDGGRAAGILIAATLVGLLFSGLKIPEANIIAVDYDPGASEVNQLNRIKLMLATAQKNLNAEAAAEAAAAGERA